MQSSDNMRDFVPVISTKYTIDSDQWVPTYKASLDDKRYIRWKGDVYTRSEMKKILPELGGPKPTKYMLNNKGRHVPEDESDLVMSKTDLITWKKTLYKSVPKKIELESKDLILSNDDKVEFMCAMYVNRDLGSFYNELPERVRREKREKFVERHFPKISKKSKRKETEQFKEIMLEASDPEQFLGLFTEYFRFRYKNSQVGKIYDSARDKAKRDSRRVFSTEDVAEMNRDLELRDPEHVPFKGMEDCAYVPPLEEPTDLEPEPEETNLYMWNGTRYVPEDECTLRANEKTCRDFQGSLLRTLKGGKSDRNPDKRSLAPNEVLQNIKNYVARGVRGLFWETLPESHKRRKFAELCEKHGLDPTSIRNSGQYAAAFVQKFKERSVIMHPDGSRSFKPLYAKYQPKKDSKRGKDIISQQEQLVELPCSHDLIDKMNSDLYFPEPEQMYNF